MRDWAELALSPAGAIPKIIISEAGNFPDLARFYREEVVDRGMALMRRVLRLGIERGEFRAADDLDNAVRCIVAPLLLAMLWRHSLRPPRGGGASTRRRSAKPSCDCCWMGWRSGQPAAVTKAPSGRDAGRRSRRPPVRLRKPERVKSGQSRRRPRHEPDRREAANTGRAARTGAAPHRARRRSAPTPTARARARPRGGDAGCWLIALVRCSWIGVIAGGVDWWLEARNWVSTDDAFIDTHTVQVSSQVAGRVKTVPVNDNQEVARRPAARRARSG